MQLLDTLQLMPEKELRLRQELPSGQESLDQPPPGSASDAAIRHARLGDRNAEPLAAAVKPASDGSGDELALAGALAPLAAGDMDVTLIEWARAADAAGRHVLRAESVGVPYADGWAAFEAALEKEGRTSFGLDEYARFGLGVAERDPPGCVNRDSNARPLSAD